MTLTRSEMPPRDPEKQLRRKSRFGDSDPWGRHKPKRRAGDRTAKRNRLDSLNRRVVRRRDADLGCCTCGSRRNLQVGHFLPRTRWRTRWILSNTHLQCKPCNDAHESNPKPYRDFMRRTYGQGVIDDLERQWHSQAVVRDDELDEWIGDYEKMLSDARLLAVA